MKWMAEMAILKTMPDKSSHGDRTLNRIFPVTVKLTKEELGRVTDFARSQGLARGEWIPDPMCSDSAQHRRATPNREPSDCEVLVAIRPAGAGGVWRSRIRGPHEFLPMSAFQNRIYEHR